MIKEVPCMVCDGKGFIAIFSEYSVWSERCSNCGGTGIVKVPMTNADRIRDMSDEELAKFIATPCQCEVRPKRDGFRECGNDLCLQYLLKWLRQPAEEDT